MPRKPDVQVEKGNGDPMQGSQASQEIVPAATSRPVARKGALELGWKKHRLIREIALGEKTGKELADQYGVSQNSMSAFKKRYAVEIEEVRNNLADEYAGVWVAQKLDRIRQYQEAAEKMASGASPRNQEVLVSILKAVAEELGDLPARTQVNVSTQVTEYQIVGLSPEDI